MLPVRFLLSLLLLLAPVARAETVRLALVVGSNAGRGDLPPLRYAESDAGKVARVLAELGEVREEHLVLLQGRRVAELEQAIGRLNALVKALKATPENRTVLFFYFSGHSDGEAIELGQELLSYSRLKSLLAGIGTDVRVVVVDACRSGSGFRSKGARPVEAFSIKLTDSLTATGDAFIASSAADESALESNEMMGSVFTHHLVSGLRGAADASGDKLVTLGEAYRYAYDQTVARTSLLPVGAQHPSYDYKMSGQGELVLTSLVKASAQLVLPQGMERAVVTDVLRDQVIAELPTSAMREVALPPGQYGLRLYRDGKSYGGRVAVADGARREVSWDELSQITSSIAVARKGPGVVQTFADDLGWQADHVAGVSLGIVPSVGRVGLQGMLRVAFEPRLGPGFSVAVVGVHTQVGTTSESGVEARGGWRYALRAGPAWFSFGAELGPALLWQSSGGATAFAPAAVIAPRVGVRVLVGGPFVVTLDGEAAVALLPIDGRFGAAFRPSGTLGVAIRF